MHVAQICSNFSETSKCELVSMLDSSDKIELSSRFFKDVLSRYGNLLSIFNVEFYLEFKELVVLLDQG